ncbi:MAG: hypothetical protein WBZ20_00485 [Nitrososphaeraceae archaeon]
MQCLKIEMHAVTAVTAVVVVMMVAAVLYLVIEIKKSRKMILQGEN